MADTVETLRRRSAATAKVFVAMLHTAFDEAEKALPDSEPEERLFVIACALATALVRVASYRRDPDRRAELISNMINTAIQGSPEEL